MDFISCDRCKHFFEDNTCSTCSHNYVDMFEPCSRGDRFKRMSNREIAFRIASLNIETLSDPEKIADWLDSLD